MISASTLDHEVVSKEDWERACLDFLTKEKELTRLNDELGRQRRELPWTQVQTDYIFDGPQGEATLSDLFAGCSQLATYHFMFGPDWPEGCPGCSFVTDHLDGAFEHLRARDVSLVLVSRAPRSKLIPFQQRMGWRTPWYSSGRCEFNSDFRVGFTKDEVACGANSYNFGTTPPHGEENPGLSLFYKDADGSVFRTYSTFGRGLESLLATYAVLDRVTRGRDEGGLPMPMAWLRHHDKYEQQGRAAGTCCHK